MFVKTVKVNGKNYYYLAKSIYDKKSKRSRQEIVRRLSKNEVELYYSEKIVKNAENGENNEIKAIWKEIHTTKRQINTRAVYTPRELPIVPNKKRDNGKLQLGMNYGSLHSDLLAELKERFSKEI